MTGVHTKSRIVTFLCLGYLHGYTICTHDITTAVSCAHFALLLERVGQIAVGIRKVRLELYGSPVSVNG